MTIIITRIIIMKLIIINVKENINNNNKNKYIKDNHNNNNKNHYNEVNNHKY